MATGGDGGAQPFRPHSNLGVVKGLKISDGDVNPRCSVGGTSLDQQHPFVHIAREAAPRCGWPRASRFEWAPEARVCETDGDGVRIARNEMRGWIKKGMLSGCCVRMGGSRIRVVRGGG